MQTVEPSIATARHPLDPLSPEEIEAASGILRRQKGLADTARFVFITLDEPDKATVLGFHSGGHRGRRRLCGEAFSFLLADRPEHPAVAGERRG